MQIILHNHRYRCFDFLLLWIGEWLICHPLNFWNGMHAEYV
jgi:hypothetical protein